MNLDKNRDVVSKPAGSQLSTSLQIINVSSEETAEKTEAGD